MQETTVVKQLFSVKVYNAFKILNSVLSSLVVKGKPAGIHTFAISKYAKASTFC